MYDKSRTAPGQERSGKIVSQAGEASRLRAWLLHVLSTGHTPQNNYAADGFIVTYRRWRYEVTR